MPIDTPERREVIALARAIAAKSRSHSLRWPNCTWKQARGKFYRYMAKLGCTLKDLGITAHGLRHGYAQEESRALTGFPTPIEGGAVGQITWEAYHQASQRVSVLLGHSRVDVVGHYCGSYGHALRPSVADAMQKGVSHAC